MGLGATAHPWRAVAELLRVHPMKATNLSTSKNEVYILKNTLHFGLNVICLAHLDGRGVRERISHIHKRGEPDNPETKTS